MFLNGWRWEWHSLGLPQRCCWFSTGNIAGRRRAEDLLEQFNEVRRAAQLDPGAAEMLHDLYV